MPRPGTGEATCLAVVPNQTAPCVDRCRPNLRLQRADFISDLVVVLLATGATLAFDAVGGGELASKILTAMEGTAHHGATGHSGYGSTVYKHVDLHGALDPSQAACHVALA